MATQKIYTLKIEATQAQQALDTATKTFIDLKNKAAAANQEVKETRAIYKENADALKELVQQQKALEAAKKSASAGAGAVTASAALDKNLAAQKQLNSIVQESKIDFLSAKQAAEAAGAAVGKQAGSVKELQTAVKAYGAVAAEAAQTFAPGTVGALGAEVKQLKADLQHLAEGSAEAAAAVQQIGEKEAALRKLAVATRAANPEAQARAFSVLTGALTGTVGIAITGAQVFGLSEQNAAKYTQRMQQLTGVLASVDGVSRLLNGENLSLIKSIVASGRAWLTASEAASTGAKVTRAALISTGIGAVVALVGTLIALWVEFSGTVGSSESTFTRVKAAVVGGFEAMLAIGKDVLKMFYQFSTFDFAAFNQTADNLGKDTAAAFAKGRAGVLDEARRAELAQQVEHYERYLRIEQAAGVDTENLERELLRRKLAAQKKGSKEELDAAAELAAFNKAARKKHHEELEAQTLAHLNRLLALEQAHGREVYEAQLRVEQQKLAALKASAQPEKAAIEAQQGVLSALTIAHERELAEKLFAARQAALEGRIAMEEQKGEDAFKHQLKKEKERLVHLQAAGTQDAAAIQQAKDAIALLTEQHEQELDQKRRLRLITENQNRITLLEKEGKDTLALKLENAELLLSLDRDTSTKERTQRNADYQKLLELQADYNAKVRAGLEANQQQRVDYEDQGRQIDKQFINAAADYAHEAYNKSLAKAPNDLGLKLIRRFFGLTGEQAETLKQELTQAVGALMQSTADVASAFLYAATQQADAALADAQARLQAATQQLSELQSSIAETEGKLGQSQGAARDYYLQKLAREREEVQRVAAAKAKAAAEEKKQQEEQHRLQKIGLQLSAATTLAANISAAAKAVDAGVSAVREAAGSPWPTTIPAIITAIATVAATVASARQLATATKYEAGTGALGSDGVLRGPRHAGGGIQLYSRNGHHFGEAEGGEAITPVDATRHNAAALALIRTQGRTRTLGLVDFMKTLAQPASRVTYVPPPARYLEAGGILNRGAAPVLAGGLASEEALNALAARLDKHNSLLEQVVTRLDNVDNNTAATAGHTASTAASNEALVSFGPPRMAIGHSEVMNIEEVRQEALGTMALAGYSKETLRKLGWLYG